MTIILLVIIYGFYRNGLKFLGLFVPQGVPGYLLPLVVAIEVMSFLSRPISLSVRLFANMLAGHITLKVFASFILMLGAWGVAGWVGAVIPFAMTVALTRARNPRRIPAGLRLRHPDLHVSERRASPLALTSHSHRLKEFIMERGCCKADRRRHRLRRNGRRGHRPRLAVRQLPAGAIRNPAAADGQFGRLIFGFAVTEALGIFSLLIALLLIFAV